MKKTFSSFRTKGFKRGVTRKHPLRLQKKHLLGPSLKAKKFEAQHLMPQIIQYRLLDLNKAYLISLSSFHTWNYTLPDHVIGSFIRMFLGIFMQRGNLVTMLNFLKKTKTLSEIVTVAHSRYKISYPSFPSTLEPKTTPYNRPHLFVSRPAIPSVPSRKMERVLTGPGAKTSSRGSFRSKLFKSSKIIRMVKKDLSKKLIYLPLKLKTKKLNIHRVTGFSKGPKLNVRLPKQSSLAFWNLLYQQPLLNYSLKYCRLSRRVRKILKNKYRYSKYYFIIAPYKRRLFTLHLWKYILKFHDERTFFLRLTSFLKNFTNPDPDSLLWSLFYTQQRLALKKLLGR